MKKIQYANLQLQGYKAEYCKGKVIYDKKGAQTSKNARYASDHVELRIYECPDCRGWHLTKQIRRFR